MKRLACLKFLIVLVGAVLLLAWAGPAPAAKYVGSDTCGKCHFKIYNEFVISGHPYKLRKAEDARKQGLPLPEGYTWDDISYVIGGRNWKARYVDKRGYIITMTGPNRDRPGKNQYNLETDTWSDYHPGQKKPYNCGRCHTTGYKKEGHQDGLPGIIGTWAFPGVQCEACHGPGSEHAASGGKKLLVVDRTSKFCGRCHIRGKANTIPASKGFIRHHEQYNELLASPKKQLGCVTCHDPHKKAKFAMKIACKSCHQKAAKDYAGSSMDLKAVKCEDCHMPEATKSAVKFGKYKGDVKTHLFKINLDPKAKMFTPDGKFANGYLTVEFACLSCHREKNRAWALSASKGIHRLGK